MDKRKAVLNISVSITARIILVLAAFLVRRFLILHIGNDVNGLNSLYSSIIGLLAVAELGIGSAISFSMYKPIVDGNDRQVNALYNLYKKLYYIIGVFVFFGGLVFMPFLPRFISDYDALNVDVYLTFFLTLVSVVLSYLYASKTALIEAYKNNYITTGILTISNLIRYSLQILSIMIWKSFSVFVLCKIIGTVVAWGLTELYVRKRYRSILFGNEKVDTDTKIEIIRNSKAMCMHKIGAVLVNTIDSVVISAFIGVVILGKYSNYVLIADILAGLIGLVFTPLTSIVGHLCVIEDREKIKRYFDCFYCLNYILGVFFFIGYYAVIDEVVKLCFGAGLEVSRSISFIITLNQFIKYMRNSTIMFRNASGTFYYDRWKPIAEGLCNMCLSLWFVMVFPDDIRIVGVIVATILTSLGICHIVDPYVVYKYVFRVSVKEYYFRNYCYIMLFTLALFSMGFLSRSDHIVIEGLFFKGIVSVAVSFVVLLLVSLIDKSFWRSVKLITKKLFNGLVSRRCDIT